MPHLSAALPALRTAGPFIVDARTDDPVRLRGVNRSGLEYADPGTGSGSFLDAVGITREEIDEIVRGWGATVIRLPFTQDFVLRGRGARSAADYLDALDRVIGWAAAGGCYTLLDLQWLDADRVFGMNGDFTFNRVPPLPDERSIETWRRLAARYRDEPAVLFDLFNEPHDPLPDDSADLLTVTADGAVAPRPGRIVRARHWRPWARHLIDVIRGEHPTALIFVSGVRWAYDLRDLPFQDPSGRWEPDLVYSTHVYPWSRTHTLRLTGGPNDWDRAFGHLAGVVPLFAGEWGGQDEHVGWGAQLLDYFEHAGIGWTAWSWSDWPHLVCGCRQRDYTPTAFGHLVRRGLLASRPPGHRASAT
jgi:hypothetical protein